MDPKLCRGCGNPVDPAYEYHRECLQAYRRSFAYRDHALERDGRDCVKCPQVWNDIINAAYARRWNTSPEWVRATIRQHRYVEVDHIDPLGAGGDNEGPNLQVLCKRHHAAKTRIDMARMKGRPRPMPRWVRPAIGLTGLTLVSLDMLNGQTSILELWPYAAALLALLTLLLLARHIRSRVITRLRAGLAEITGDSLGKRRNIRARRWRWRRIDGRLLPRLRPTRLLIRYPHTFPDHDPARQTEVEAKVAAKLGSSWSAHWNTQADEVALRSPDPLVDLESIPWPNRAAGTLDLWNPIPVGLNEAGQPVTIELIGKNLLIGGEPEAGKSVAQSMITATAALDPDVVLHGIDGKGLVELGPWRDSMENLVGSGDTGHKDACDLLQELRATMDLRYDLLYREQRRKIERGDGLALHVLIIDELALFTAGGEKKDRERFTELLRDVISRGRAAGIITVAATQRPSADVVPTQVRDLIGYRWAMRCATPASSDMILGQGQASAGFSAAKVAAATRGIGYLLAEGDLPVRLRSYRIDDPTLHGLAARAARLRSGGSRLEPAEPAAEL